MAKRLTAEVPRAFGRPNHDLDAWHVAHDARNDLANVLLRLQVFARSHASASARQATVLIQAVLTKLDDLEEERPSPPDVPTASRARSAHRVGHA
jgi:hypothetical protein